jgi:hypothetical protein
VVRALVLVASMEGEAPQQAVEPQAGDGAKKRKKYTITKERESWTAEEHQKFCEALERCVLSWRPVDQQPTHVLITTEGTRETGSASSSM